MKLEEQENVNQLVSIGIIQLKGLGISRSFVAEVLLLRLVAEVSKKEPERPS